MKEQIKEFILGIGADVCGVANIDRFSNAPEGFHPKDIFPDCKSVIVFGISLPKGLTKVEPRLIYGHFNYAACPEVDWIAFRAAREIERLYGGYAVPLPSDGPYEYWDAEKLEGRGLISMKHAAVLAGLGTLGKNTLLLNEKYGNLLVLGVVLTDLDLVSDQLAESICIEGCSLCIRSCPSQALDGQRANQTKCRPNTYGTNARGYGTVNCNKCRAVCPMRFGKKEKSIFMDNSIEFTEAKTEDLSTMRELYNYYIMNTTVTFDLDKITLEEFKNRVFINHDKYKTFLIHANKELLGFCFLTQFKKKPAYDKTAELGLYLKPQFTGKGIGIEIVNYMENIAKINHFEMIIASISGENVPSMKLFRKLGYEQCAHYKGIAVKFGRKMDLVDFQKAI
ncbi:MAG TPA: GNAT family N-acetyltransferase [Clostridia bacterium]|nr:GNAT family N-acetyltransferase [Clostridia bacterium]